MKRSAPGAQGIHKGHRQRLKNRFLTHGADNFADVNLLELLLFFGIPQRDTNPVAHALLSTFGSLSGVFDAAPEELMKIPGISENTAALIKLIPAVAKRYQLSHASYDLVLDTTEKCGDYLVPFFYGETSEAVYLLGLDAKCKVLGCVKLFSGTVNCAQMSVRRVVEVALNLKASTVILAHNHTSGIAVPSGEDVRTTRQAAKALDMVGILLADHVVVADDDYVSMMESGLFQFQQDAP